MDSYIERLTEAKQAMAARMREIIETAGTEKRDLSPEENENLTKWDADYDRLAADEKRLLDLQTKTAAGDALREAIAPVIHEARIVTPGLSDQQLFARLMSGEHRGFDSARTIPLGYEARALSGNVGTAIPTTFADFVTVYERTLNPILDVATVLSTNTGAPIVLPRLTTDVTAGGSVTAEAGTITEGDPTISQVTLTAFKIAHITLWSAELDQDEVIGLEQLVASSIARPIGLGWGTFFATGTGTVQPNGFINAGTNGGTAAGTTLNQSTDTFFAASDLVDLFYGLAAPYRGNASWQVSNTALAKMRKFRDSTGQFLWSPALQAGEPEMFLNRPVYENPGMAAVASAAKSVAVGDFSKYIVRDVVPMRIDVSDQYKYNIDQLAIRVVTRRDGNLPDAIAIRYQVCANT